MNVKQTIFDSLKKLTKHKFDENSNVLEIGIDSLDLVELITDAEDKYSIEIKDEELEQIKTVGDIVKKIEEKIKS